MRLTRPMRSKLFVPGSRPELFAKALASEADSLSIDLEDAVAENRKHEAREATHAFLVSAAAAASPKIIIVRVNAPGTVYFLDDIRAVTCPRLDILNLPMVESASTVRDAAAALERHEREFGIDTPIGILANIETPLGLRCAREIASADPRANPVVRPNYFSNEYDQRTGVAAVRMVRLIYRSKAMACR